MKVEESYNLYGEFEIDDRKKKFRFDWSVYRGWNFASFTGHRRAKSLPRRPIREIVIREIERSIWRSPELVAFSIHRRTVPSFFVVSSSSSYTSSHEQNRRWIRTVRSCYRLTVNYNLTHEKNLSPGAGLFPAPRPLLRDSLSRDRALISTSCSLYTGCSRWITIVEIGDALDRETTTRVEDRVRSFQTCVIYSIIHQLSLLSAQTIPRIPPSFENIDHDK